MFFKTPYDLLLITYNLPLITSLFCGLSSVDCGPPSPSSADYGPSRTRVRRNRGQIVALQPVTYNYFCSTMSDHYYTIEKPAMAEFKDRGSRFLGYAFPIQNVDDFKKRLKELKEEHPKAVHHCFAYRLGTDGNNFRANDDGEPSGSAGKPILGQLDSKGLTNTAVVVVRYFGGTLLGVPGLINAYKTTTSLALQLTPILQKPILIQYELQFDYTLMNDVMVVVKRFGLVVLQSEMQLFCKMVVGVPKAEETLFLERFQEAQGIELKKLPS